MSGIVGSYFNTRGSGVVAKLGTDGQLFTSAGAGVSQGFEAAAGGGKIGQVLNAIQTDVLSAGTATWADITGLTLAITPVATSSKILWSFNINVATPSFVYTRIVYGDASALTTQAIADTDSNHLTSTTGNGAEGETQNAECQSMMGLDSPATASSVTYKLQWQTTGTIYMNRMYSDTDSTNYGHSISSITLQEILA